MKWLAALMTGLGLAVGFGLAVATHHAGSGATGFVAVNQTGFVEYPPKDGASWLPGLVVFPMIGALAGLVVALLLATLGFRLTRTLPRGASSSP